LIFTATPLAGAFVITPERLEDDRGFFARTYCIRELAEHGLDFQPVQSSISYNHARGTLRGMHFQAAPHEETKLVSVRQGAIHDVILDVRRESPSYGKWFAVTLTAAGHEILFIPKSCAHGFITLADDTVVQYEISEFHHPECARGIRYDDPTFAIEWPMPPAVISDRDRAFPLHRDR
jgi:dTDP-4-dehydrorhamnose 3,5-epimerase